MRRNKNKTKERNKKNPMSLEPLRKSARGGFWNDSLWKISDVSQLMSRSIR